MCGIAGFIAAADLLRHSPDELLAAMLRPLEPRGPDGAGQWSEQEAPWRIGLGHRRLAILDLSPEAGQPMHGRSLSIVFNGEVYNYLELRRELQALGHDFRTRGDTEVLLAAYEQWGRGCLQRLNGMFAFAIWDAAGKTLFCARDRAGERPFYYFADGRCFVFASEIKALLAFGSPVPCAPNWPRLAEFAVADCQDLGEETFFEAIRQLRPGRYLTAHLDAGTLGLEDGRYWEISAADAAAPPLEADELRDLLTDSVRIRLRSDVPVGTCLSGGIDSPSVAATIVKFRDTAEAAQVRYQGVHAFVPDPDVDERSYVNCLAERLGFEVSLVEVTADGCRQELDELVYRQEYPFAGPSVYAQRCVFRRAAELGLKVMLDGQGADELFGGYDWAVSRAVAAISRTRGWFAAIRSAQAIAGPRFPLKRLLARAVLHRLHDRHEGMPDDLAAALRASFEALSLPALLQFADRNCMSFGVEARLPFLDHRLIEAATRLAPEDCIAGGQTKAILRAAMRDALPEAILRRRDKTAFAVPTRQWVQNELRWDVREATGDPLWKLLDFPGRKQFLSAALGESEGISYRGLSWKVLCLTRWYHRFF